MSFSSKKRHSQQGYMLLTLMLFVTLLAIASLGWIEKVDFQIKRDREQELIHRGVQYSRAIRRYVRKFGHYPARIEDLQNTNNIHFLRKRYKDPITGKDFKLLHQNDVQLSFSPASASGLPPGAPGAPGAADASSAQGGAPGSLNANPAAPGGVGPVSGSSQNDQQQAGDAQTTDDSSNGDQTSGTSNRASQSPSGQANPNGIGNGQTFGGLPIVGVASTSKDKSIREFNKKDHYNQWQFIYDPSADRGGLITTPNLGIQSATIPGATQVNQMGGQPNGPGQPQGPGFGPGGMNSPFGPGGVNTPSTQPTNPQPQNQQ
jgi:type II secretory pathway pseudopilin PulG